MKKNPILWILILAIMSWFTTQACFRLVKQPLPETASAPLPHK